MRTCLTFVLAVLLSLNSAFAVAASYCQHQKESPQAAHFGHHVCQYGCDCSADKSSDSGTKDCGGFCHLSFSSLVPDLSPMLDDNNPPQLVPSPVAEFCSATVDPFDRPPLARLA